LVFDPTEIQPGVDTVQLAFDAIVKLEFLEDLLKLNDVGFKVSVSAGAGDVVPG
jgi:hypothetical protein